MSSATTAPEQQERPGAIDAKPVRHPWRYVAIVIIAIGVAMMINSFVTNSKWDFAFAKSVFNYNPVLKGLIRGTVLGTLGAMVIGIIGGVLLAVMRLSENPVLKGVAFVYTWFFRSIPRLVLLVMLGSGLGFLYPHLDLGIPFGKELHDALGLPTGGTIATINVNALSNSILIGIIGLGLSEAAYMAEIARAGILSVDQGQAEAASALGMSRGKAMRRIILPQAMRVIVPPTGNETIAMVKDTSLLSAVPVTWELWNQVTIVSTRTGKIMGAYVAGFAWYLIVCSVLMLLQAYLERKFGRGFSNGSPGRAGAFKARMLSLRGGAGGM